MSLSSDMNHRNLSCWLKEFGCMDGNLKRHSICVLTMRLQWERFFKMPGQNLSK